MATDISTFGGRLRSWRNMIHMTQADLADRLEIDRATLRNYETDSTQASSGILSRLCDMGLNINWLLTARGSMYSQEMIESFPADVQLYVHNLAQSMLELSELDSQTLTMLARGFAARSAEAVKLARYEAGTSQPGPLPWTGSEDPSLN